MNKVEAKPDFRNIVRVADTDLKGNLSIERALCDIKGINQRVARVIAKLFSSKTKLSYDSKLGDIPKDMDEVLTSIIRDPEKSGITFYLLNRRKDRYTGKNMHLISSDLDFTAREDKQRLSRIKARRGLRLNVGLRVRGQRAHSNFRRGKGGIGVIKAKETK